MSKYIKGKQIKSLKQLLKLTMKKKQSVYFNAKVYNCYWVLNQQVQWLGEQILRGNFFVAKRKQK